MLEVAQQRGWLFSPRLGSSHAPSSVPLLIPFPFSPFHEGELRRGGSPRITQEILRRGPILIDPLIPPRFNSAPRASFLTKTFHLSIPPYFFFLFFPFFFSSSSFFFFFPSNFPVLREFYFFSFFSPFSLLLTCGNFGNFTCNLT